MGGRRCEYSTSSARTSLLLGWQGRARPPAKKGRLVAKARAPRGPARASISSSTWPQPRPGKRRLPAAGFSLRRTRGGGATDRPRPASQIANPIQNATHPTPHLDGVLAHSLARVALQAEHDLLRGLSLGHARQAGRARDRPLSIEGQPPKVRGWAGLGLSRASAEDKKGVPAQQQGLPVGWVGATTVGGTCSF